MDIKKMLEAHEDVKKCLQGDCGHKNMSKCMDKIAGAHEVIGDELNGEAEKAARNDKRNVIQKVFERLDTNSQDWMKKAINLSRSSEPELVD